MWIVGLLVLPLVVAGFVLAGMGVLVDPPPTSVPAATPASPAATPVPGATPAPGAPIDAPAAYRHVNGAPFVLVA